MKRLFLTLIICFGIILWFIGASIYWKHIFNPSFPISTQSFSIPIYEKNYYLEQIIPLDPEGESWWLVYRSNGKKLKIQVKLKIEIKEDIKDKVRLGKFKKER